MTIQVLFAAMYQVDMSCPKRSNVSGSYVVVNQTDFAKFPNLNHTACGMTFFSTEDRGLSNSRNRALELASADICLIADDDLTYYDGYEETVSNAYLQYPDADLILFNFDEQLDGNDRKRKPVKSKSGRINYLEILRGNSVRISFKLHSIKQKGIRFNPLFGAGSGYFSSGEDLLFLADCYQHGLKIYYVDQTILRLNPEERPSSWFMGYNEQYYRTIGAFAYKYSGIFWRLYLIQFIIRHANQDGGLSFVDRYKQGIIGVKTYKKLIAKHYH